MHGEQPSVCIMGESPLDRIAYALLLEHQLNIEMSAESDFSATSIWAALRSKPKLILFHADGVMADMASAIDMISRLQPEARVLIIAHHPQPIFRDALERRQVHGMLAKQDDQTEFCSAVRAVMNGSTYLSGRLSEHFHAGNGNGAARLPRAPLSRRENELLPLLASGMTLREAAVKMSISYKTADSYRTNLFRKLGVKDRVDLARYAIREHIIEA